MPALFDGGHVNEDIRTAVVGMDESISLLKVEPLHGSDHDDLSLARPPLGIRQSEV
jgi:hypothetical protein